MQPGDPPAVGRDVPTAAQPHRGVPGGEVERAGDVGPPVDDERGTVRVVAPDTDPADVVIAAVAEYQPTETQAVFPGIEGGQQTGLFGHQDIALQPHLGVVALRRLNGGVHRRLGQVP